MMDKVLVTDGNKRSALSVARSLGKRNIPLGLASDTTYSPAFFSKYCRHTHLYTSPSESIDSFLSDLLQAVKKNNYDILLPMSDSTVLPVSKHRDKFLPYTAVPLPEHGAIEKATDKIELFKLASDLDIPCSGNFVVQDRSELEKLSSELGFPVVVKSAKSRLWHGGKMLAGNVLYAKSRVELMANYDKLKVPGIPLIVQEYIPGPGVGVFALFNNSEPRAVFAHRRLREVPYTGGPSSLRESIKAPDIEQHALKLLSKLNWHGVAMVEFKLDSRDNTFKLIEVNPRFWGSLQLAIVSGVDFPYLLYKMVVDGDVEPVFEYKVGVKCRWLVPGDIMHLISVFRGGPDFIARPSRIRSLVQFLKFYERDLYYDYLSFTDPKPMAANMLFSFYRFFSKGMHHGSSK